MRLGKVVLVGIPLSFLILFFYYPLANILREAFSKNGQLTWDYLARVLTDTYFFHIFIFTFWQALLSTLASIAIGFFLAYVLTHYEFPLKRAIRSLMILPFVLPTVTVALGFTIMLGSSGWLNQILTTLFGLKEPLRILYSLPAIVIAHAFYNAPIIARTVHAAWQGIDPRYEECARMLGASRFAVFRSVTLPMLLPSLFSGSTLVFVFCFLSFPIVLTLGGARFSTLEVEIYTRIVTMLDFKLGAALALVGLTFSLIFVYLYLHWSTRYSNQSEALKVRPTVSLFAVKRDFLRPQRILLLCFLLVAALLFLGPIASVILDSLRTETSLGSSFTLTWYAYLFKPEYDSIIGDTPLAAIMNSLQFGIFATLLALVLGTMTAYLIARSNYRGRALLDTLMMAPLAVSSVILAFGLLRAFLGSPLKLAGTSIAIVLAHTIIIFPFVVRTVTPILESLDKKLVEAARTLGATAWQAFFHIELKLIAGGILVGALFAFALSLGEMSATLMLARPGLKTMPIAIYDFLGARQFGPASAMSVLMMAASALAFLIIERVGERALR
jgi:thiamine transport system permease protein